jgi:hypothetical protein
MIWIYLYLGRQCTVGTLSPLGRRDWGRRESGPGSSTAAACSCLKKKTGNDVSAVIARGILHTGTVSCWPGLMLLECYTVVTNGFGIVDHSLNLLECWATDILCISTYMNAGLQISYASQLTWMLGYIYPMHLNLHECCLKMASALVTSAYLKATERHSLIKPHITGILAKNCPGKVDYSINLIECTVGYRGHSWLQHPLTWMLSKDIPVADHSLNLLECWLVIKLITIQLTWLLATDKDQLTWMLTTDIADHNSTYLNSVYW